MRALQENDLWRRTSSVPSSLPRSGNQGTQQSDCISIRPGVLWKNHSIGLMAGDRSQLSMVGNRQTRSPTPHVQIPLFLFLTRDSAGRSLPSCTHPPPPTRWQQVGKGTGCALMCEVPIPRPYGEQGRVDEPVQRPSPALTGAHGSLRGGCQSLAAAHACGPRGSTA